MTYYASFVTFRADEMAHDILKIEEVVSADEALGAATSAVTEYYSEQEGWTLPKIALFEGETAEPEIELGGNAAEALNVLVDAGLFGYNDDGGVEVTEAGRTILAAIDVLGGVSTSGG